MQRWKDAIELRHSSRTYSGEVLPGELNENLKQFINTVNKSIEGVRAVLVEDGGDKVVLSIMGSYGLIKGVRAYIAFIADMNGENLYEKIGYLGEMCVLEATAMGLDTCWISGTFKPQIVEDQLSIKPDEKVIAITPVGYSKKKSLAERIMKKVMVSHKRKPLEELCQGGYNPDWPKWINDSLNLARVAPSAVNKQPWCFVIGEGEKEIKVKIDDLKNAERKKLDCGIVMLHLEIGALSNGIDGKWSYLELPDIAVYNTN